MNFSHYFFSFNSSFNTNIIKIIDRFIIILFCYHFPIAFNRWRYKKKWLFLHLCTQMKKWLYIYIWLIVKKKKLLRSRFSCLWKKHFVQFAVLIQTHEKVRTSIPLSINNFPTNYEVFRTLFVFFNSTS